MDKALVRFLVGLDIVRDFVDQVLSFTDGAFAYARDAMSINVFFFFLCLICARVRCLESKSSRARSLLVPLLRLLHLGELSCSTAFPARSLPRLLFTGRVVTGVFFGNWELGKVLS